VTISVNILRIKHTDLNRRLATWER